MRGRRLLTVRVPAAATAGSSCDEVATCATTAAAIEVLNEGRRFDVVVTDDPGFVAVVVARLPEAIVVLVGDGTAGTTADALPAYERLYCLPAACPPSTVGAVIDLALHAEGRSNDRLVDQWRSLGLGLKSIGRVGDVHVQIRVLLELAVGALEADCARLYVGDDPDGLRAHQGLGQACAACEPGECDAWARRACMDAVVRATASADRTRHGLAVPVVVGGRLDGAAVFVRRRTAKPYSPSEEVLASTFCTAIAVAVERERGAARQERVWTEEFLRLRRLTHREKKTALVHLAERVQSDTAYSLGVMSRLLDLMVLKEDDEGRRNNLGVLRAECRRLRQTIDAAVDDQREQTEQTGPVDVNRLVDEAIRLVEHLIPTNGVTVARRLASTVPPVDGGGDELQLLVVSLLLRIIEETGGGGDIDVQTGIADATVFIRVSTAAASSSTSSVSLGGLASCLERRGGRLQVTEPGQGQVRYEVRLPRSHPPSHEPRTAPSADDLVAATRAPLKVLVVDDEQDIRYYFRALLQTRVEKVTTAPDVAAAEALLHEERYDVMFLDSRMARGDGLTFFAQVVQPKFPDLPVVLFTGSEDPRDPAVATAGFYGVLTKPCRGSEIFGVLEHLLRGRQGGVGGPRRLRRN